MGDARSPLGRQERDGRAALRLRARTVECSRLLFLPLFTRPAAPRLATRDDVVQVNTNHPRVRIYYTMEEPMKQASREVIRFGPVLRLCRCIAVQFGLCVLDEPCVGQ